MAGMRKNEEDALDGTASDDLVLATPDQAAFLSGRYLGRRKTRLNSADRHEIAARMARELEAKEREQR